MIKIVIHKIFSSKLLVILLLFSGLKIWANNPDSLSNSISLTIDFPALALGEFGIESQYRLSDKYSIAIRPAIYSPGLGETSYEGFSLQIGMKKYFKTTDHGFLSLYYTRINLLYKNLKKSSGYDIQEETNLERWQKIYNDYSWKKVYKLKVLLGKEVIRGSFVMDCFIGTGIGLLQVSSKEYYSNLDVNPDIKNDMDLSGDKFLIYPSFHIGILIGINFTLKKKLK